MASAAQAEVLERSAPGRLLVFGSLPPDGRDLDVLVRDEDLPALAAGLAAADFEAKGVEWARFRAGGVEALELVPGSSWWLGPGEVERLLGDSIALPGRRRLTRPAPADELLILARRLGPGATRLAPKHRARIDAALAADPSAWDVAARRAPLWAARGALAALRRLHRADMPATPPARLAARREMLRARGVGPARSTLSSARAVLVPRSPRGAIVALSGMDGAGKSTQAEALAATLRELGHDSIVEWSRITYDSSLRVIARPAKRALAALASARGRAPTPPSDDPSTRPPRGPEDATARALRSRYPVVNQAWASVVAGVHAWGQRRQLVRHLRRGRVVVRDRYVLDSAVQLRQTYGHRGSVDVPLRILRRLSPTAVASFWLDVPAEVAYGRKPEQFPLERLAARRPLYQAELERAGAVRLDGTRPAAELAAQIARETWRRLP